MPKLLNDEMYGNQHIIEVRDEIEKLYRIHNSVRDIIDMVKSDETLCIFYKLCKAEMLSNPNHVEQDHEPEIYLLRKTLCKLSEFIKTSNIQEVIDKLEDN